MLTVAPSPEVAVEIQLRICDRCGAQGKLHIDLTNGNDLVFCSHHAMKFKNLPSLVRITLSSELF